MVFVWTEALGCPEILPPSLSSYLSHHAIPLTVFLYEEDAFENPNPELITVRRLPRTKVDDPLPSERDVKLGYESGHSGTALLWSHLVALPEAAEGMVHLDADNIYLRNVVDAIVNSLKNGATISGFRRAYFKSPAPISALRRSSYAFRQDKVHTMAFGFLPGKLPKLSLAHRRRLISGAGLNRLKSVLSPNLDFFDGAFDFLSKAGGVVDYIDEPSNGRKLSRRRGEEPLSDLRKYFLSFDAVGSGCVAFKRLNFMSEENGIKSKYSSHGIEQYAAYSHHLLNVDIGVPFTVSPGLHKQLEKFDKASWALIEK